MSARIVATPGVCSGQPCIKGTRIPTREVADRLRAGDSITEVYLDLNIGIGDVEEALRFEMMSPARRRKYLAGGKA